MSRGRTNAKILLAFLLFFLWSSCSTKKPSVTLYVDGHIYTCDSNFRIVESIAVANGKILAAGFNKEIQLMFPDADTIIALNGATVYPGLQDAHGHFYALGRLESRLNCKGVSSWDSVISLVTQFAKTNPKGWILGRGWDQSLFQNKSFPNNKKLNQLFPKRPVLLRRVDGHAAIANQAALDLAGITLDTKIEGGEVEVLDQQLTGFLVDNAVDRIMEAIPLESNEQVAQYLLKAQELCLNVGLTSITDAGLSPQVLKVADSLYQSGKLKIRLNAMISATPAGLEFAKTYGPIEKERFRVKSFKIYGDGALGSRGALLKRPYCDRKDHSGLLLTPIDSILKYCKWAYQHDYQICTHAIGDSANRLLLDIYSEFTADKDLRWRIEHAQIVNPSDIALFGRYNVIPSVQPTHATSDMRWAEDRLCEERMPGAYAYQSLMRSLGWIALGTDFPIEDYDPKYTFFAAVYRKNLQGDTFLPNESLAKKETLMGMTSWAARAQFAEHKIGSLAPGMDADFIILSDDWFSINAEDVLKSYVNEVYIQGVRIK